MSTRQFILSLLLGSHLTPTCSFFFFFKLKKKIVVKICLIILSKKKKNPYYYLTSKICHIFDPASLEFYKSFEWEGKQGSARGTE
jgi:hypothetical protein